MLGIKNVSRDCATKFQCNASNNYNEKKDPVSKVILLDVKCKLKFSISLSTISNSDSSVIISFFPYFMFTHSIF